MREFMTRLSDYLDEKRNDPQRGDNRLSIVLIGATAVVIIVVLILLLCGYVAQEKRKREDVYENQTAEGQTTEAQTAETQEIDTYEEEPEIYMADDSGTEELRQEYLTSIQYLGDKVEELLQTMTQVQQSLEQTIVQYQQEDSAIRQEISVLHQEVSTIVQNLKETQNKLYDLTDIVQVLDQEKIPLIQQQIQEIKQDMGQVHTDIAGIYKQIAALKKEDEKLWAQIGALEENLETAMNQNITEVNNQLDVLLAQLETVESRIYNLASQTLKYHYDAASNTLYLMPYEE